MNIKLLFNVLSPNKCVLCDNPFLFEYQNIICDRCLKEIKKSESFYCRSCGKSGEYLVCDECTNSRKYEYIEVFTDYYEVKQIIHAYKFKSLKILAKTFADIIRNDIETYVRKNNIQTIFYIPISKSKLKERGFNHLKEILKNIFPTYLINDSLVKIKNTKMQVELSKAERLKNLEDSFLLQSDLIHGNVLVFDDILTTGATLREVYKAIKDKVDGKIYAYVITKA